MNATATDNEDQLWRRVLDTIRGRVAGSTYEMWWGSLDCVEVADHKVVLRAPDLHVKEFFDANYHGVAVDTLSALSGRAYGLEVVVSPPAASPSPMAAGPAEASPRATTAASFGTSGATPVPEDAALSPGLVTASMAPNGMLRELNPRYMFDSFVIGSSNQLAHAAALNVASSPGSRYNPLFIYGSVGLGKTHLLHAIGHAIAQAYPRWRISYVWGERFMNDFIHSLRTNRMDEFRRRYREECDVLLMDDIQFIAGKDRTQDEFFHTFNSLRDSGRQIVMTSDKLPREIPELEDRLRSRFEWGLMVDIHQPDLETRIAILKKKAELEGLELADDVAHYLANLVRSNVRELEGALVALMARAAFDGRAINVDTARTVLADRFPAVEQALSVDTIMRVISTYFGVKITDLRGPKRHRTIARPRQIAMYLSRRHTQSSYPEIGRQFGKDHTTVIAAERQIAKLMATDPEVRSAVATVEKQLDL